MASQWNLCNAPGIDEPRVSKSKVDTERKLLAGADKALLCTHARFRFAVGGVHRPCPVVGDGRISGISPDQARATDMWSQGGRRLQKSSTVFKAAGTLLADLAAAHLVEKSEP